MKLPSFQFYPGDWRKDPGVQALSFHDRGVWFEILCLLHESEDRGRLLLNGKPMPDDALARLLGLDKQVLTNTLTNLLSYGVASRDSTSGALVNRRMVKDEDIRRKRKECGKMGGNPVLVKREVNQNATTMVKQKPTPSSSTSFSTSTSINTPPSPPDSECMGVDGGALGMTGAALGIERCHHPAPRFTEDMVKALYAAYPRRESWGTAMHKIKSALLLVGDRPEVADPFAWLLERVNAFADSPAAKDLRYVLKPDRWFDEQKFDDDPAAWNIDRSASSNAATPPVKRENPIRARINAMKGISQ